MHKRYFLAAYRLGFGLLTLAAITTQLLHNIHLQVFNPVNFFSFFTIESNVLASLIYVVAGVAAFAGKQGTQLALLRGAATLYMTVTGIIYILLLAGLTQSDSSIPWVNVVLHYIMPLAVLADWLVSPPAVRIAFKQTAWWLVFPVTYLIYSLIRGHIVSWYPYPFLNPANGGYIKIAVTGICIATAFVALTWVIASVTRLRMPARPNASKKR